MYYIGIDGGGSTSRLLAVDENDNIIAERLGGATNLTALSSEAVSGNISELLRGLDLSECKSLCIGTAGIADGGNIPRVEKIFRGLGYKGKLKIVSDAVIALMAETKGEAGIVVISGTGSIAYAIDKEGNTSRCGGWGALIDDGGSGCKIGMEAIRYALMAFDGRGKKTVLEDMINKHFGLKQISDILKIIYSPSFEKAKAAKLSKLVSKAAKQKDEAAMLIEEEAALELAKLAKTLIKKHGLYENFVVLSGGILLNNSNIQAKLSGHILEAYPKVKISKLDTPAEMGAVYMAKAN